jgi:chromosomal replication initiator protein
VDNPTTAAVERSANALWEDFLESVRPKLSSHVLETWLRPVRCTEFAGGKAVLEVRDQFFRDWLTDHYNDFIRDGLSAHAGEKVCIEWSINPAMGGGRVEQSAASEQLPQPPTVAESINDGAEKRRPLNRRYIFDSFVCGPSNQFAFAACKAVAQNPGNSYNPLFIFGGVGLGKTHLLSAIGHQILTDNPKANVIYTSSEQFTNEVINAVLGSKLEDFRNKYRSNCDVILIDDIQLIAGKERTQHEFFHIFNTLYDSQRQIVVTSDKLPHEIPEIEERLRNRFQWGLIADVQPPEIETRIAILRKKANNERYQLPDEVAFFLAKNIRSNVRELEGALVRIMAHASLTGTALSVDYARNVLSDVLSNRGTQVSIEAIQKIVASYFQVRVADLKSRRRLKALVRPRQVAMYLSRKHTGSSYPELGSRFGDKDHTTIMSACNRIKEMVKADASLRGQVLELERQLDLVNR